MKRNAIICAAVLSLTAGGIAHAANQGAYAGLGLGADKAKLDNVDSALVRSLHGKTDRQDVSLAGRIFGGYNFNQYLGLEAGYNAFGTSKVTIKSPGLSNASEKYKLSSFDLRGKAYLPLMDNNANVYAIAGLAYAKQDVDINDFDGKASKSTNRYRPVYGVGANYNVTPQITAAVEATRQKGVGNMSTSIKAMPNVDTVMFTVAYNFA